MAADVIEISLQIAMGLCLNQENQGGIILNTYCTKLKRARGDHNPIPKGASQLKNLLSHHRLKLITSVIGNIESSFRPGSIYSEGKLGIHKSRPVLNNIDSLRLAVMKPV